MQSHLKVLTVWTILTRSSNKTSEQLKTNGAYLGAICTTSEMTVRQRILWGLSVSAMLIVGANLAMAQTTLKSLPNIIARTDAEAARIAKITEPTTQFGAVEKFEANPGGGATVRLTRNNNAFSQHSKNISFEDELTFKLGNALFRKLWVSSPSSTLASDGLGPLYNARSCQRCHLKDGRGHPPANADDTNVSLVMRLAQLDPNPALADDITDYLGSLPDPVYGGQLQDFSVVGHPAEGKFSVSYTDKPITLSGGEVVMLQRPKYSVHNLGYGALDVATVIAPRIAPQMIGLGLLEAIPDADILARQDPDDANNDGISGRANIVHSRVLQGTALGRFGLKAHSATVLDQSALAFGSDIGISTTLYPAGAGDCTDAQAQCQAAPDGSTEVHGDVEISDEAMALVDFYARNLGVPKRRNPADAAVLRGKQIFYQTGCIACHAPKHVTHSLNDQDAQSFQLIWPYTDLLLHDMGTDLADGTTAGKATGQEWRTPPLWGVGLTQQVSGHTRFLHDGRARNLLEAILWHGGEAEAAKQTVISLTKSERDDLIAFIESL